MYNLAFIADTLPFCHNKFSGAELSCEYISKEFKDNNTRVFYLTSKRDYGCEEKVYELPKSHSKEFPIDLHVIKRIIGIFRDEKPDWVYLYTKKYLQSAVVACTILNIPMIYSVVDYHILCPNNILKCKEGTLCTNRRGLYCQLRWIWFKLLIKLICRNNGLFWTFTDTSERRLEEWGIPSNRIVVRYQFGIPSDVEPLALSHPSVVFVGSFAHHKGIPIVIKTFRILKERIPDISCYMVGDDSFYQFDWINAVGHVPHNRVLQYIAGADVIMVAEQWYSDFGNVVVFEANKLGIPVVAGNVGSACEFTEHIVEYDKPKQYVDKIVEILNVELSI